MRFPASGYPRGTPMLEKKEHRDTPGAPRCVFPVSGCPRGTPMLEKKHRGTPGGTPMRFSSIGPCRAPGRRPRPRPWAPERSANGRPFPGSRPILPLKIVTLPTNGRPTVGQRSAIKWRVALFYVKKIIQKATVGQHFYKGKYNILFYKFVGRPLKKFIIF